MRLHEVLRFFVSEHARLCNESYAERYLEREARATAFGDVDREFGVLPEFKLVFGHVEIATGHLAKPDVRRSDNELTLRITHRRRPVAASAGLVEHEFAVFGAELFDYRGSFRCDFYTCDLGHALLLVGPKGGNPTGREGVCETSVFRCPRHPPYRSGFRLDL